MKEGDGGEFLVMDRYRVNERLEVWLGLEKVAKVENMFPAV